MQVVYESVFDYSEFVKITCFVNNNSILLLNCFIVIFMDDRLDSGIYICIAITVRC